GSGSIRWRIAGTQDDMVCRRAQQKSVFRLRCGCAVYERILIKRPDGDEAPATYDEQARRAPPDELALGAPLYARARPPLGGFVRDRSNRRPTKAPVF